MACDGLIKSSARFLEADARKPQCASARLRPGAHGRAGSSSIASPKAPQPQVDGGQALMVNRIAPETRAVARWTNSTATSVALAIHGQQPEQVQGVGMIGMAGKNLAIGRLGLGELPALAGIAGRQGMLAVDWVRPWFSASIVSQSGRGLTASVELSRWTHPASWAAKREIHGIAVSVSRFLDSSRGPPVIPSPSPPPRVATSRCC